MFMLNSYLFARTEWNNLYDKYLFKVSGTLTNQIGFCALQCVYDITVETWTQLMTVLYVLIFCIFLCMYVL